MVETVYRALKISVFLRSGKVKQVVERHHNSFSFGGVGQLEESVDSKPIQCGFESHHRYKKSSLVLLF